MVAMVLHNTCCLIAVARWQEGRCTMFDNILICTDGSATALKAAKRAVALAKQSNACVLLLNVLPNAALAVTVPWQLEIGGTGSAPQLTAAQQANLEASLSMCKEAGLRFRCRHESGHAAEQILRVAEDEGADLIVMGSRGLNEWKALMLGSVSDHVVHHAPCSVLIVR